jgi:hypothetical protein
MKRTAKLAIILVCILLCGTGAMLVSKVPEKREPQKAKAIPVKNREISHRVLSWA